VGVRVKFSLDTVKSPKTYRVFQKKVDSHKTFWNIFTSVRPKSFCVKFCKFVGNSYPRISTNFWRFILIFHQMALIFPRVPIVFTLSSFEYSPIKWKCRGRFSTAWFTQNGWASAVDSTGDFLNSAQLPPFVRVTGNYWFCTKSLLTKRLHAQFVVLRQFLTTKLKNNVSKMLIVKNRTVIDYLQSPDTKTRDDEKWRHFRKAAFLFSEWIGLLKTWESENDG